MRAGWSARRGRGAAPPSLRRRGVPRYGSTPHRPGGPPGRARATAPRARRRRSIRREDTPPGSRAPRATTSANTSSPNRGGGNGTRSPVLSPGSCGRAALGPSGDRRRPSPGGSRTCGGNRAIQFGALRASLWIVVRRSHHPRANAEDAHEDSRPGDQASGCTHGLPRCDLFYVGLSLDRPDRQAQIGATNGGFCES
jgi:hypothetical protein